MALAAGGASTSPCSSGAAEHRRRVESRTADIPGHQVPTWVEVQADGWVPWDEGRDGARVVIDTTCSEQALRAAVAAFQAP